MKIEGESTVVSFSLDEIPDFTGETASVIINGNEPFFAEDLLQEGIFLPELDPLGRCGATMAVLTYEGMPRNEERGSLQGVKPAGWHTVRYDDLIEDKYLFNRCHLLGWQLTGLNDDTRNLITGTRYLNVEGMLPYENQVAEYIRKTKQPVLYRVTPIYIDSELIARGVEIEALSLTDDGEAVSINVYCYNNQPGIEIDYATGESRRK